MIHGHLIRLISVINEKISFLKIFNTISSIIIFLGNSNLSHHIVETLNLKYSNISDVFSTLNVTIWWA